jgi:prepilin-type N-terminal cleavage/methylation domain-containing protein
MSSEPIPQPAANRLEGAVTPAPLSVAVSSETKEARRGFTLVEAVLALAIMTISAVTLLSAASRCLAVARLARNFETAAGTLSRGETEYPLVPTNEVLENVVEPVTYDNGFVFSRTVDKLEDEEDMFVVHTRVSWSARGKDAFEEVATYLYSTNHT